jgi:hypothetical protein
MPGAQPAASIELGGSRPKVWRPIRMSSELGQDSRILSDGHEPARKHAVLDRVKLTHVVAVHLHREGAVVE